MLLNRYFRILTSFLNGLLAFKETWRKSQSIDQLLEQGRDDDSLRMKAVGLQHLLESLANRLGQLRPQSFERNSSGLDEAVELDGLEDVVADEIAVEDGRAEKLLDDLGADASTLVHLQKWNQKMKL